MLIVELFRSIFCGVDVSKILQLLQMVSERERERERVRERVRERERVSIIHIYRISVIGVRGFCRVCG